MKDTEAKLADLRARFAEACDAKFYADEKAEEAELALEEAQDSGVTDVKHLEETAQAALAALPALQDFLAENEPIKRTSKKRKREKEG